MKTFIQASMAALLFALTSTSHASDQIHVTKLRLAKVVMFDAPSGSPIGEIQKDQYVPGTWVLAGEPQAGYIMVNAEGKSFWVKSIAIDTNKRVSITAECGIKVSGNETKIGATRALGEECK